MKYISDRAYYLWEQSGRPEGREQEFWLQAEAEYEHGMTRSVPPRKQKVAKKTVKKTTKAVKKTARKTTKKKKK
ncbi:MAG: DUF2934 domain-containing protein [Gemmatimonadota bacterium]|nr:DUF2934 domain-containing protein [Gemmatimonadota bacterium]